MTRYTKILLIFALFFCLSAAADAQSCTPPPSGMVAWWPGDGNANDIIGGNNGTLAGGVTFAPGEVGQAFSFNGTSALVSVPDSVALELGESDFTIAFWLNTTNTANWNPLIWKSSCTGTCAGWGAFIEAGSSPAYAAGIQVCGYCQQWGTQSPINDGLWHHVAFTRSGTELNAYLDGENSTAISTNGLGGQDPTNSLAVLFGASPSPAPVSYYEGLLDEIQLFNRALPVSDIQAIYNAGSAGTCESLPALSVSAKMDIYRAGGYNDGSDGVAPAVYSIQPGTLQTLTFSGMTGTWACSGPDTPYGPDGTMGPGCVAPVGGLNINPIGSFSGYANTDFAGALTGVFLADSPPASPPPSLRFYISDSSQGGIQTNFTNLSPQIGQVFFIGDGLTGTGAASPQVFQVPPTATHLYLGYLDSCNGTSRVPSCFYNNKGAVTPTFSTSCGISISPTSQAFGAAGGIGEIVITTLLPPASCPFGVTAVSWIHPQAKLCPLGGLIPCSPFGPPLVSYLVDANATSTQRIGTLTVGGQVITVTQSGKGTCAYSIKPSGQIFSESGGKGTITVTAQTGCSWSAVSTLSWVTISSGSSGSGNGTVTFTVAANSGTPREGILTIAGQTYSVTQSASGCGATDVSNKVNVALDAFLPDLWDFEWVQTVSLYNKSSQSIPGPIYLVMDGLPRTGYPCTEVGVTNPTCNVFPAPSVTFCGSATGSDLVLFSSGPILPGQGVSGQLQFLPPPGGPNPVGSSGPTGSFGYTTRVFSGTPTEMSGQPGGTRVSSMPITSSVPEGSAAGSPPSVTYWVSLDTSPLIGHPAGPFSVAFELADGSAAGDGNDAVLVSSFQFGVGGAPSQTPVVTGSVFGDLSSSVSLIDSGAVNFFYQTFTPGATLTFEITTTTNTDAGGILDEFVYYILDNTLTPIPTMAGAPLDIFSSINLTTKPVLQVYASDPSRNPAGGGGPINIPIPLTVELSPGSLDFGAQAVGTTSKSQSVTLTNTTSGTLTISGITITGTNPGDFAQANACPSTLAAGSNCAITITFTPSATGVRQGTLTIIDDEATPQTVVLSGKGT